MFGKGDLRLILRRTAVQSLRYAIVAENDRSGQKEMIGEQSKGSQWRHVIYLWPRRLPSCSQAESDVIELGAVNGLKSKVYVSKSGMVLISKTCFGSAALNEECADQDVVWCHERFLHFSLRVSLLVNQEWLGKQSRIWKFSAELCVRKTFNKRCCRVLQKTKEDRPKAVKPGPDISR